MGFGILGEFSCLGVGFLDLAICCFDLISACSDGNFGDLDVQDLRLDGFVVILWFWARNCGIWGWYKTGFLCSLVLWVCFPCLGGFW